MPSTKSSVQGTNIGKIDFFIIHIQNKRKH